MIYLFMRFFENLFNNIISHRAKKNKTLATVLFPLACAPVKTVKCFSSISQKRIGPKLCMISLAITPLSFRYHELFAEPK